MATDPEALIDLLLEKRGITDAKDREDFLSPDYDTRVHDPFLLKDMDKAAGRLYQAVKNGERIAVFSDYDADGIPGGVLFTDFLKKIGCTNFEIYIPHRHDEGFGLNTDAIDDIASRGAKLLITIDCGIADTDEISYAQSKGLDVIITDHHEPHGSVDAYAVIDPKQNGCAYPNKHICGAGVAFKFIQAFLKRYGEEFSVNPGWEKWLLDMVGIATLSDMVSLTGENRVFAHYGLIVMRKSRRAGLNALFSTLRINKKYLTEDDIGFSITPRINAASRMGTPDDAFNLLSASDSDDVGTLADKLEHVNNERKGTVAALVKEVRKIVEERNTADKKIIVAGNPNWRPSLLGLAANTFADEFSCPVFLWGRDGDNMIKGSARSGGSVNLVSLMSAVRPGIFADFGGHAMSGGFTVAKESVALLESELETALVSIPKLSPVTHDDFDAELSLDDVSYSTYDALARLAPFGIGNPKPKFLFKKARVVSAKTFGKEKNHFEITFKSNRGMVKAIQFFHSPDLEKIQPGDEISYIGNLEKSSFGGKTELRVRIVELV